MSDVRRTGGGFLPANRARAIRPAAALGRAGARLLLIRAILFPYFILMGFLQVDEISQGNVFSRVVGADVYGLVILALAPLVALTALLRPPRTYILFGCLIAAFAVSGLLSEQPGAAAGELLVIAYGVVLSLAIYAILTSLDIRGLDRVVDDYLLAAGLLAGWGVLGFVGVLPAHAASVGGLVGGFRNTGQAGSFFGIALAIATARLVSGRSRPINVVLATVIAIALVLTIKRSALIGVGASLALLLLFSPFIDRQRIRQLGVLVLLIAALAGAGYLLMRLASHDTAISDRLHRKVLEYSVDRFSRGFWFDNIKAAIAAFEAHPILGVGLGNIQGRWTYQYEIHSTYFTVLSSGGLVGILCYLGAMGSYFQALLKGAGRRLAASPTLVALTCFLAGNLLTWLYTNHLRRREFWLLLAIGLAYATVQEKLAARPYRPPAAPQRGPAPNPAPAA